MHFLLTSVPSSGFSSTLTSATFDLRVITLDTVSALVSPMTALDASFSLSPSLSRPDELLLPWLQRIGLWESGRVEFLLMGGQTRPHHQPSGHLGWFLQGEIGGEGQGKNVTVSWPSGLVHWTHVLVLSECGFESRPGRSRCLCP